MKYSDDVRIIGTDALAPPGWFVFTWRHSKWYAISGLPFQRKADASRAAACLTTAGLNTAGRLEKAGWPRVRQIACENLQW